MTHKAHVCHHLRYLLEAESFFRSAAFDIPVPCVWSKFEIGELKKSRILVSLFLLIFQVPYFKSEDLVSQIWNFFNCNAFIALLEQVGQIVPSWGRKKKKKKTRKYHPSPSPQELHSNIWTHLATSNLQKWSRNYIMNCPNTRHTVGFLVNQILTQTTRNFWLY